MRRRALLHGLGAVGVVSTMQPVLAMHHRHVESIGLQLYTIREAMAGDAPAALAAVAEAGYHEVETAGTGNLSPADFAGALKNTGLTAPSAHLPINLLRDKPEEVLKLAQTIGYQYVVVPWLPVELRNAEGYAMTTEVLNKFGAMSAAEGVQVAYHNHDFEFEKIGGETAFDGLLKNCDPELVKFELDLYWAAHAGVDAETYLQADPQRYPLCHVKDRAADGAMVDVGDGEIDFQVLFKTGTGLKHYFVEHDRPSDPMASIKRSIAAVRTMRF